MVYYTPQDDMFTDCSSITVRKTYVDPIDSHSDPTMLENRAVYVADPMDM